jgi:UTP--glucose-1-phosphate uridylyltransferase
MKKIKKAIIPAAGLGTRFLPATKSQPKEMLPIVDKPTIQYIIEEAIDSGIESILIVTGRGKMAIENHFDRSYELEAELLKSNKEELYRIVDEIANLVDLCYTRQKSPRGLGHAIGCGKAFIGDEPFAVLLGDDVVVNKEKPALKQLIEQYDKTGKSILGVQRVANEHVSKYGIVDPKDVDGRLSVVNKLVEKPSADKAPSNIAILGRYVITPDIFDVIDNTNPGVGGEIQLTDALNTLAKTDDMYAYEFEGKRYDVGTKIGFLKATVEFALDRDDLKDEFLTYLKEIVK